MKRKYYESRFKPYSIFGWKDHIVDLSDSEGDVATEIKRFEAERIISERDEMLEAIIKFGDALEEIDSDKFKKIWYGEIYDNQNM